MPTSFAKSRSLIKWEQEWQKDLDSLYTKASISRLKAAGEASSRFASSGLMKESSISVLKTNHRALCKLQRDIFSFATEKCTVDNFEDKWRAAGPKLREKHYFEAMKRVCDVSDMEVQRKFAPEISLSRFQELNGKGYLDLLKSLLPDHQTPPNQYVRIGNPAVEALFGMQAPFETVDAVPADPQVFGQRTLDLFRCLFMSLMVWHTLLSLYHLSEDTINVRSERKSDYKLTPDRLAELKNGGLSEATINAVEREHKQAQKLGVWLCANCKKYGPQLANSKLKECSKCISIGRHVYYCSRDCQTNDWKHGDPPHKTVCGKLIPDVPTSPKPSIQGAKFLPPRTFRPSLALERQMSLLKKNPSVDYFLIPPAPLPDIGITMAEPNLSKLFLGMRDRAFEMCDKEAVGFMFKFLQGTVKGRSDFGLKQLEKQLGAEFGMDDKELQEQVRLAGEDLRALRGT